MHYDRTFFALHQVRDRNVIAASGSVASLWGAHLLANHKHGPLTNGAAGEPTQAARGIAASRSSAASRTLPGFVSGLAVPTNATPAANTRSSPGTRAVARITPRNQAWRRGSNGKTPRATCHAHILRGLRMLLLLSIPWGAMCPEPLHRLIFFGMESFFLEHLQTRH